MKDIIGRPPKIVTVGENETVRQAASKMLSNHVGCLIVNDEYGKFIGLVTERDISHRCAIPGESLDQTPVAEIMTRKVVWCEPGTPTGQAREIMTNNRIRHLPIMDNGVVIGILSARDLMGRQLAEDRAAAEEVAMLSNCLKSIDINEAAKIITEEAPKLFQAKHCVLCLYINGTKSKKTELVCHNQCPCSREHLTEAGADMEALDSFGIYQDEIPAYCDGMDVQPPRLIIPISFYGPKDHRTGKDKHYLGYLCMCGLAKSIAGNKELTSYKAKLAKEIVTSHLRNATLYQQAMISSLTDALTGVGSRKLLEDKLQIESSRAGRYHRAFSIAIIDLDKFKSINDTLGHATGDEAIKMMADLMKQLKRESDILTRYGGDEFVILMPETSAKDAGVLLERLRATVNEIKLSDTITMSISGGIAQYEPGIEDSSGNVMRRADLALYEAKNSGRNCIRLWDKSMADNLNIVDIEFEKIEKLRKHVAGMSEQAEKIFMQSIWSFVQTLEAKDPYAKKHSVNVVHYAVGIAEIMKLAPNHIELIKRASMIHDIGKIGIPDSINLKSGILTPRERKAIQQHPMIAAKILKQMSFLEREIEIIKYHHERWNGQGYPEGRSNTEIPLGARILAVADTFDALTSSRSYREALSVAESIRIINDSAGYDFDTDCVKAMGKLINKAGSENGKTIDDMTKEDVLNILSHIKVAEPMIEQSLVEAAAQ